jgi:hypothetical protein
MAKKKAAVFCMMVGVIAGISHHAHARDERLVVSCAENRASENTDQMPEEFKNFGVNGQVRVRGDWSRNQNLRDLTLTPGTEDNQVVSRTRLNVWLEPGESLKLFAQGQFYGRGQSQGYAQAALYQAYADISGMPWIPIEFKIGRQEFCYGSAFFLGANDFYDGLAWDGVRMRIAPSENLWLDAIAVRYVNLAADTSGDEPALYGVYGNYHVADTAEIESYLFFHKGGFKFFHADLPDSPEWFTLGGRFAGKAGRLDYEVEPLFQFGKLDNLNSGQDAIEAYGGHVDLGYTFVEPQVRVFAAYAMGRGDNGAADGKYREFHGNIYHDNYLVGDIGLIPDLSGITIDGVRASGVHSIVCGLVWDIFSWLNLNLDYHWFRADATPAGISLDIGREADVTTTCRCSDRLSITAGLNRFFSGSFFEDVTGSAPDVNYVYLQTQIEF